jgi:hypothetical protein
MSATPNALRARIFRAQCISVKPTAEASLEAVRRVWKSNRKLGVYGEGIGSDRAERVAKLLKTELGTREVYLLEGGWAAWPRP